MANDLRKAVEAEIEFLKEAFDFDADEKSEELPQVKRLLRHIDEAIHHLMEALADAEGGSILTTTWVDKQKVDHLQELGGYQPSGTAWNVAAKTETMKRCREVFSAIASQLRAAKQALPSAEYATLENEFKSRGFASALVDAEDAFKRRDEAALTDAEAALLRLQAGATKAWKDALEAQRGPLRAPRPSNRPSNKA